MNKLWIAQYNSENGGNESLVLFSEEPTQDLLGAYAFTGCKLESLRCLELISGESVSSLPLERTLTAEY